MNQQLQDFARKTLIEGLLQLPDGWQEQFKLMYARNNGKRTVEDAKALPLAQVIAQIPADKLDWAMTQVQNSLNKQAKQAQDDTPHIEKEINMSTTAQAPQEQEQGNPTYNWLDKASRSGLPDVEHAATVLKDYYEGVDASDPRSLTQQYLAKAKA